MATKRDLDKIMSNIDKKIKHIRDSIYYELELSGFFDDIEEEEAEK